MFYNAFPYYKFFSEGKLAKREGEMRYNCPYDYGTKEYDACEGFDS